MSGLREAIQTAAEEEQCSMRALTVGADHLDPFRSDTPANRRDGEWLGELYRLSSRSRIHLRGLHYVAVVNELVMPNGQPYRNTFANWQWLGHALKYARWLEEVPFSAITDQRTDPPSRYTPARGMEPIIEGLVLEAPEWPPIEPIIEGAPEQPYRVVIFAEKASAGPVLISLARDYGLTLYLGAGDPSDTMAYQIASDTMEDQRPLMLLTLCDCDPYGWNMPPTLGRKFQAFGTFAEFKGFDFRIRRIGLAPAQVRDLGLPSTPLKPGERNQRWLEVTGTEQTELDALATLQPQVLTRIATQAIEDVLDATLEERTQVAIQEWQEEARRAIEEQADTDELERIDARLTEMSEELQRLASEREEALEDVELPEFTQPDTEELTGGSDGRDLVDSEWTWLDQTKALRDSKAFLDAAPGWSP